jgi:hypothetical protein
LAGLGCGFADYYRDRKPDRGSNPYILNPRQQRCFPSSARDTFDRHRAENSANIV